MTTKELCEKMNEICKDLDRAYVFKAKQLYNDYLKAIEQKVK